MHKKLEMYRKEAHEEMDKFVDGRTKAWSRARKLTNQL
jgi:cephalosporin-C deacetylase-like acetyl esterase